MSKLDEMFTCTELGPGFEPIKKSKEMSKDTPEVGDVFESNGKKFTIVALYKWQGNVPTTYLLLWDEGHSYYSINMFSTDGYRFQDCAYLGHSKATIDDLFKTEKSND